MDTDELPPPRRSDAIALDIVSYFVHNNVLLEEPRTCLWFSLKWQRCFDDFR
jgi:hypothetical protein